MFLCKGLSLSVIYVYMYIYIYIICSTYTHILEYLAWDERMWTQAYVCICICYVNERVRVCLISRCSYRYSCFPVCCVYACVCRHEYTHAYIDVSVFIAIHTYVRMCHTYMYVIHTYVCVIRICMWAWHISIHIYLHRIYLYMRLCVCTYFQTHCWIQSLMFMHIMELHMHITVLHTNIRESYMHISVLHTNITELHMNIMVSWLRTHGEASVNKYVLYMHTLINTHILVHTYIKYAYKYIHIYCTGICTHRHSIMHADMHTSHIHMH